VRTRSLCTALLALGLLAASAGGARAHVRSTSTSSWDLEPGGGARVVVRVRLEDLQRVLPDLGGVPPELLALRSELGDEIDEYLAAHAELSAGGAACIPVSPPAAVASLDPTHLVRRWRVRCPPGSPLALRIDLFLDAVPGHLHLARLRDTNGRVAERAFVQGRSSQSFEPANAAAASAAAAGTGFTDYVRLGIEHIATGYDHLVFLLALLLAGASLGAVATIVTGFTVAHSVTLALGVLGFVKPLSAAIEALIGLSIAVVALENFSLTTGRATRRGIAIALGSAVAAASVAAALGVLAVSASALLGVGLFALCYLGLLERSERPARLRWFVAFVFGLIHGFGFAGLLAEIGLPPGRVAPALLGFNVGVELGQLAIVALAWPLLSRLLAGPPERRSWRIQLGSSPILAAGIYWFVSRALA
jgi:hypothetical protein